MLQLLCKEENFLLRAEILRNICVIRVFFLYIYGASFKWQIEEKRKCAEKGRNSVVVAGNFQFLQLKLSVLWVFCRI